MIITEYGTNPKNNGRQLIDRLKIPACKKKPRAYYVKWYICPPNNRKINGDLGNEFIQVYRETNQASIVRQSNLDDDTRLAICTHVTI